MTEPTEPEEDDATIRKRELVARLKETERFTPEHRDILNELARLDKGPEESFRRNSEAGGRRGRGVKIKPF